MPPMQDGPVSLIPAVAADTQHLACPQLQFPFLGRVPLDRSGAVFTIIETLKQLGQERRTSTLMCWLGRFDGLEMHLEEEHDPLLCVRQLLLSFVVTYTSLEYARPTRQAACWKQIVQSILSLDFVQSHSSWGTDTKPRLVWNPMAQPWLEFLKEGRAGETLTTWIPESGNPPLTRRSAAALLAGWV